MTIKIDEDKCIQYYSKLNLDHSSPSQEAMDDALWLVNYCYWDQEKRRQKNVSYSISMMLKRKCLMKNNH
jgi:hypothetical protein